MKNESCDRYYIFFVYLELMMMLLLFVRHVRVINPITVGYVLLLVIVYPVVYLLPTIGIAYIIKRFILNRCLQRPWHFMLFYSVLIALGSATVLIIFFDYQLYSLFDYHINNPFVVNLLMTPGGIDSVGVSHSTEISYLLMSMAVVFVNVVFFFIIYRLSGKQGMWNFSRSFALKSLVILLLLLGVEEVVHGFASFMYMDSILQANSTIPLNLHLKFNSLLKALDCKRPYRQKVRIKDGQVVYPLQPVHFDRIQHPYNIVWLTVESLRWDMLDPKIMPNLWRFSQRALKFNRHYSGGNRTRMGMFTMFYGLYPNYWYSFEKQAIGPVFMDALLSQKYQMTVNTSQSFSYPELYRTVFANVPGRFMHELKDQSIPPWKRDEMNITQILKFMDQRKKSRPFFVFMFFESTHAPYNFTDRDIIYPNYLRDMNYAHMNLLTGIDRIKGRYMNAAHCVDRQVGRVLEYLTAHGLLKNTIFLITGDHGEEFMEHGHWGHGHNAAFPEQQVHVPLVLWLPGTIHREINTPTSHIDIIGTLAPLVGIHGDLEAFSQGTSLLDRKEKFQIFGNYRYMCYMDARYKIIFPFRDYSYFSYKVTTADDRIMDKKKQGAVVAGYKEVLNRLAGSAKKYVQKKKVLAAK